MSLPRLIAICGHARAGKDTCAAYLETRYGFTRYALAEPLKEAVLVMFGWTRDNLEGPAKEAVDPRFGLSPRQALQALGTEYAQRTLCQMFPEFRRTTGRSLWVKRLLDTASATPRVVISDCRFPHEADAIHAAGGIVIRVYRPDVPPDLSHASERSVAQVLYDFLAVNRSTIADLQRELDAIMHTLAGAPESELRAVDERAP